MLILWAIIVAVPTGLIYPGWRWLGGGRPTAAFLFAPLAGATAWLALAVAHVGAQSMSNLVELFAVAAAALCFAYVGLIVARRKPTWQRQLPLTVHCLLVLLVLGLRLFMPELPE